ncbi:hypothetical protein BGX27_008510 [Mortierella sp. AM989]|nr:hypothetical protein BGX27_008510 [Mortierella sp. AM989]
MSNKPSAKAIAKLNATTLFPEIRKEIEKNPSLFAIRGFFIFNITKRGVHMTEWYLLFQGFNAPAVVSQKRPEIPKAKRDEQPIPVAIIQIEDSDLLNFMSGGLTGSRGIVSGKIKIAGAMELAEELEQVFRKAKGTDKTLAYLEHKRGKSEKARARLASTPPTAGASKVQNLARRYSALSKQAASETHVPQNKVNSPAASKTPSTTAAAIATAPSQSPSKAPETIQEQENEKVEELSDKIKEVDLAEVPLHQESHNEHAHEAETTAATIQNEPVFEEPVQEEPVHEEPAHKEPVHEEPVHEVPVHVEPTKEPEHEQDGLAKAIEEAKEDTKIAEDVKEVKEETKVVSDDA